MGLSLLAACRHGSWVLPARSKTCSTSTPCCLPKRSSCATPFAGSATRRLRPHVADWFEAGEMPARELAADLGKLGLLGMHLTGYGCSGSTATAYGLVCQELEAVDSGLRSLVSVQGSLAMFAIHRHGTEEQREQWLPPMATGDVDRLLRPDRVGLRLESRWDAHECAPRRQRLDSQRLEDVDHQRHRRRRRDRLGENGRGYPGFVVPTDTPGFSARTMSHKLSLRASITSELAFDDVRCLRTRNCLRRRVCRARWHACRRPGSGSCSARSVRPVTACRRRSTT